MGWHENNQRFRDSHLSVSLSYLPSVHRSLCSNHSFMNKIIELGDLLLGHVSPPYQPRPAATRVRAPLVSRQSHRKELRGLTDGGTADTELTSVPVWMTQKGRPCKKAPHKAPDTPAMTASSLLPAFLSAHLVPLTHCPWESLYTMAFPSLS